MRFCLFTVLMAAFGGAYASASAVDVAIDTSSLIGQPGGIYFQFNPGLNSDPASVSILDFHILGGGSLTPSSPLNFSDGGATGSLDSGNLVIANSGALNDYGEALTFGSSIDFTILLNKPDVLTGSAGSELDVQVTGRDLLTPLLTNDPSGNIVTLSYDATGALTTLSTSPNAAVSSAAVPEPSYALPLLLLLTPGSLRAARWIRPRRRV